MEPTWTSGWCPGGGVLAGRLLGNRGWGIIMTAPKDSQEHPCLEITLKAPIHLVFLDTAPNFPYLVPSRTITYYIGRTVRYFWSL